VSGGRPIAWEDAGRQIAPLLGSYSAVAVVSSDPFAAAYVALGLARAEARHRRTVVGDLVGDVPPLRDLVSQEDAHGITDSFVYGVSLNRIGYAVPGTSNLFIMPSGTDPDIEEDVFKSAKWRKIVSGFAEVGSLLLLVAERDARGLSDLIDKLDGVVLVKDAELLNAPSAVVLARVPTATPTLKLPIHRISERAASWRANRWFVPAIAALSLLILASVGLALGLVKFGVPRPRSAAITDSAATSRQMSAPPRVPAETLRVPPPTNSGDSASAAQFTVELQFANTDEGANLFVRKNGRALPAAAISPVPIEPGRTIWYKVTAGAYTRRNQADSLLLALRNSGIPANGVATAPMALLVDSVPTQGGIADSVRATVQRYADRGLTVYALMQDDGGALIYAGAFAKADESPELIRKLRGAGLKPVLVYRKGRAP
jgi:cell division septation protein DedD